MLTMCLFLSSHLLSSDFVDDTQSQGRPHTEPAHGAEEAERLSVLWRGRQPPQAVQLVQLGLVLTFPLPRQETREIINN